MVQGTGLIPVPCTSPLSIITRATISHLGIEHESVIAVSHYNDIDQHHIIAGIFNDIDKGSEWVVDVLTISIINMKRCFLILQIRKPIMTGPD